MPYKTIEGLEHIDKVIAIDQSPIGRTPVYMQKQMKHLYEVINLVDSLLMLKAEDVKLAKEVVFVLLK